ncbi:efflux RND transporter periplasmic adaptor subunit [Methylophaga sp.]|jgi:membrane fusion protein (multidrug efflux system)|uniref:efflux RND transporter periplasmic adaptor subunit n=1 Tax=Methylophaga sp. TaxID=2024840 RepID=UPI0013FE6EB5|nr:efflux RND transporter periplasmic adaptor subunit [Methylophaga sp.]MTI62858.1 efflux RND transporter periplasmic adaptor subunit [Methylophaga sp.]
MTTSFRLPLTLTLCFSLLLSGCDQQAAEQGSQQERPPAAVNVVTLQPQTVTLTSSLPARTVAFRKADVRPQVSGIIENRLFEEGSQIEAGQQLYQIDPALYEAELANTKAQLARAEAALKTAKARENRYQNLLDDNAISRQEYDDALATYQQALAEIQVRRAAVTTAETNLDYTQVNAPISGRIGKSNVTEGALVTAQQAEVLATIHQLDPMYIDIAQPSRALLDLRKKIIDREINQQSAPTVTLTLEDGSRYPHKGKLQFAEVDVDPSTGDVVLRAIMPNPDQLLLPGMFVRAEITEGEVSNAILAPQKGISFNREGDATALVVNGNNQVESRQLEIGRAIGENWLVKSGLNAGDKMIVAGLQKVAPGAKVTIDQNKPQDKASGG